MLVLKHCHTCRTYADESHYHSISTGHAATKQALGGEKLDGGVDEKAQNMKKKCGTTHH